MPRTPVIDEPNPALEAAIARLTPEERARLSRALAAAIVAALNELAAEGQKLMAVRESIPMPDRPVVLRRAYRIKEIAAMSGLAPQTIYEKVYRGELPRLNAGGRAVLVSAAAVDAWLDGKPTQDTHNDH